MFERSYSPDAMWVIVGDFKLLRRSFILQESEEQPDRWHRWREFREPQNLGWISVSPKCARKLNKHLQEMIQTDPSYSSFGAFCPDSALVDACGSCPASCPRNGGVAHRVSQRCCAPKGPKLWRLKTFWDKHRPHPGTQLTCKNHQRPRESVLNQ